jgi:hypothetical protein
MYADKFCLSLFKRSTHILEDDARGVQVGDIQKVFFLRYVCNTIKLFKLMIFYIFLMMPRGMHSLLYFA